MNALSQAIGHLAGSGTPHALFGAVGLAAYGVLRGTSDIDLLAGHVVISDDYWLGLRGVRAEVRRGDHTDNLLGCVKIGLATARRPVDVVVPRGRWVERALARVDSSVVIGHAQVPLLRLEDIVLAKVHSGSRQDVQDILTACELPDARRDDIVAHIDAEQVYLIGPARRDWPRIRRLILTGANPR